MMRCVIEGLSVERACWTPAFPAELNYLIRLPPCSASFPYLDISPFYVYQIAIRYLRFDRLLTVFLISFRFVGFVLSLYSILYSIFLFKYTLNYV